MSFSASLGRPRKMLKAIQNIPLFLLAALFIAGCAGSSGSVKISYDEESSKTTYETSEMRLDGFQMSSGLKQTENRYYVQVSGSCEGKDCVPSRYTLDFIKEGPQPVQIGGRNVTLEIGTEVMRWEDPQSRNVSQTSTIRSGVFASVEVSSKQLSTIGASSKVSGTVGGEQFTIPHRNRSAIRALLSRLETDTGTSSEEQSTEKMR